MQFSNLEEFVELGNCLSFSKAAKRLYISQPALSTHISELEKEVGATLVIRERPVKLTAAGKLFYENASRILSLYHDTLESCQALDKSPEKGKLFIKTEYAFENIKIPFRQLVASFRKLHPSIDISIVSAHRDNILEEFEHGKINAGFLSTSFDERLESYKRSKSVETVLVKRGSLALWMKHDHPLSQKERLSIHDLNGQNYPLPTGEQFAEIREAALDVMHAYKVKPMYRNVLVDSFEDYLFSIEDGDVFLAVEYPVDPNRDILTCRPFEPDIEHRNYFVIKAHDENPATQLFLDYIIENKAVFETDS